MNKKYLIALSTLLICFMTCGCSNPINNILTSEDIELTEIQNPDYTFT